MKRLTILLALACGLAMPGAAGAWVSNFFHSPTHNIHCRYFPNKGKKMACMTQNNGRMVWVTRYGYAHAKWGHSGHSFPAGPTLHYGHYWYYHHDYRCNSYQSGMKCWSYHTGHGFFIHRAGYRLF
jgi:hypothetical protein